MTETKELPPFNVRELRHGDIAFIIETWCNSLKFYNSWFHEIDQPIYYKVYKKFITDLLDNPLNKVSLAVLPDDQDIILSYIVFNESSKILHYAYTKGIWRRLGLARALIKNHRFDYVSHLTDIGLASKPKRWKFNPFI